MSSLPTNPPAHFVPSTHTQRGFEIASSQFYRREIPYLVHEQLILRAEHDGEERVWAKAVEALAHVNRNSSKAIACLIRCSKDSSVLVRQRAVRSLGSMTDWTPVRGAIQEALRDMDESVRAEAMANASELVDCPSELVPIVLAGLADRSEAVRSNAVGQLPWDAASFCEFHPHMEKIRDLTASEDERVSRAAIELLNLITTYDPPPRE